MWPNSSKPLSPIWRKTAFAILLPLWAFLGFMLAQALVLGVLELCRLLGVPFASVNEAIFNATAAAVVYVLALAIVMGVPWLVRRSKTTKEEIGLQRLPTWLDLLWAPAGAVAYLIVGTLVMWVAPMVLPFVDFTQTQDTGFTGISQRYEYILAFISLVVIAPVAEEILFRGYLLGKLRKHLPLWTAILITSLLFAIVHFAWNVGVDVFVLSLVLCVLRVVSGSLWPSILLHMFKNGLAFYLLFVAPAFPGIGG